MATISSSSPEDAFQLFDLRVEVVCPPGKRIMCGAKEGDYFTLKASVLPLLAAKQRVTAKNDWMTTDALIACPDPCCPSQLKIVREGIRTFRHSETTAVPLSNADAPK
ncbi:hypothetical protein CNYM01_09162 [Colletotrichum nymphaeae SA-01]|uniref:TIGR04076 family protein n=1 Tax=Colletotrichum nymphaeae SA-01 TaxID=1460502 RepID=A0A135RVE5_9PEZI|nr:hypothetical protein CNYM01_09162 [Colletotrichum nymphaeae SA-01]